MFIEFACPNCGLPMQKTGTNRQRCRVDRLEFEQVEGIWRFLLPSRAAYYKRFIKEYEHIRAAEGRGSEDPAYYRALPFKDLSDKLPQDWRIRSASFRVLKKLLLSQFDRVTEAKILDLGAGNGWLSNRLAGIGYQMTAVDLLDNDWDGLGAHKHYNNAFVPVQAEFGRLPFVVAQFDAIIFNASIHYSEDYIGLISGLLPLLSPTGNIFIIDTPVYKSGGSGEKMVKAREAFFEQKYGFASASLESKNFLTYGEINGIVQEIGLDLYLTFPSFPPLWTFTRWLGPLIGRREAAAFPVISLKKLDEKIV